jgi:Fe(3+) dicitrate transport protein
VGATPDAATGAIARDTDRTITYLPVFVENKFSWGQFSITPGVRFENAKQSVRENTNTAKTGAGNALGSSSERIFVPLFGLGMAYELAPKVELYANVSQSYRPKVFTEAVPTGANQTVPADLSEAGAWQYEFGFKGRPQPWVYWDTSVFLLDFDNQIGMVGNVVKNTGRAQHMGLEFSGEIDLLGLMARGSLASTVSGSKKDPSGPLSEFGSFSLYGNATLLDAEYVSGSSQGKTPAYASKYMVRAGLVYRSCKERFRLALTSSFIGKSFSDDGNVPTVAYPNVRVPSYAVWDLTGEAKVYRDSVSLTWGVNNLFDKNYFSRITNTGIDPGQGRNFYAGLLLKF